MPANPIIHGLQAPDGAGNRKPAAILVDAQGRQITTIGGGSEETPTAARATASDSVAAGARSVTFITSQASPAIGNGVDFSGSILGVARGPGESITIKAQPGNTLAAIAYTIAGGSSLDIVKTV